MIFRFVICQLDNVDLDYKYLPTRSTQLVHTPSDPYKSNVFVKLHNSPYNGSYFKLNSKSLN